MPHQHFQLLALKTSQIFILINFVMSPGVVAPEWTFDLKLLEMHLNSNESTILFLMKTVETHLYKRSYLQESLWNPVMTAEP